MESDLHFYLVDLITLLISLLLVSLIFKWLRSKLLFGIIIWKISVLIVIHVLKNKIGVLDDISVILNILLLYMIMKL